MTDDFYDSYEESSRPSVVRGGADDFLRSTSVPAPSASSPLDPREQNYIFDVSVGSNLQSVDAIRSRRADSIQQSSSEAVSEHRYKNNNWSFVQHCSSREQNARGTCAHDLVLPPL